MVIINGKNYTTVENLLAMKANEAEKTFGLLMTGYNTLGELFSKLGIALTPDSIQRAFCLLTYELGCNVNLIRKPIDLLANYSNVNRWLSKITGNNLFFPIIQNKINLNENYYHIPLQIHNGNSFQKCIKTQAMSKISFKVRNKEYSFNPSFTIKQEGEEEPNNTRVVTLLEESVKKYKKRTRINGIPTNITIEDNTYIGTLKSFKDFFKLEMKRKKGYGLKF